MSPDLQNGRLTSPDNSPHAKLIMLKTHAVGIDLGTTYSCLSYLNEHGEPVTLPNQEGELSTPSIVLFDGGEVIVGTEALRNAVLRPSHVVQNAKRYMGSDQTWTIDKKVYTPVDIGAFVLRKMLSAAEEQIGEIKQAVITVPAQFSDWQRQATVEAGFKAGLKTVDIINEPVAAALCYVLGTEGLWFTELAEEQRILVYDLGGGTFDLSLVKYHKDEVKVIASTGDLHLGGIDWNETLQLAICDRFAREFGADPRKDPESMQLLAMAVENTKRGLTVRERAALTCSHGGHRKVYQIEQKEFEKLTKPLLDRSISLTRDLQKAYSFGLKPSDIILTTGGSSRMPMIKKALGEIGFRTPNTSLSPDQSISHGATYYAGMLLTNTDFAKSILSAKATERLAKIKQRSVNARALGILVRDSDTKGRVPHYLIPANSELPTSITQTFGTVVPNQKRVHLHIVESGTIADQHYAELGTCIVDNLPPKLPENSLVEVTIAYNEQARVLVTARDVTSGKQAQTVIVRQENVLTKPASTKVVQAEDDSQVEWRSSSIQPKAGQPKVAQPNKGTPTATQSAPAKSPAATTRPATSAAALSATSTPRAAATSTAASKPSAGQRPPPLPGQAKPAASVAPQRPNAPQPAAGQRTAAPQRPNSAAPKSVISSSRIEDSSQPIPLCNKCGEALNVKGTCTACGWSATAARKPMTTQDASIPKVSRAPAAIAPRPAASSKPPQPTAPAAPRKLAPPTKPTLTRKPSADDDELLNMALSSINKPQRSDPPRPTAGGNIPPKKPLPKAVKQGEDEFWSEET